MPYSCLFLQLKDDVASIGSAAIIMVGRYVSKKEVSDIEEMALGYC